MRRGARVSARWSARQRELERAADDTVTKPGQAGDGDDDPFAFVAIACGAVVPDTGQPTGIVATTRSAVTVTVSAANPSATTSPTRPDGIVELTTTSILPGATSTTTVPRSTTTSAPDPTTTSNPTTSTTTTAPPPPTTSTTSTTVTTTTTTSPQTSTTTTTAPPATTTTTTLPPPPTITLANGYKVQGSHTVDLAWTGATDVDIERDGTVIMAVTGSTYTDAIGAKRSATYTYRVCRAGTENCSSPTQVVFG